MTHSRPEAAAGALPFNILPAHACAGSAGWRPREMAGAHDMIGGVSSSGFGIRQWSGILYTANRAPSCVTVQYRGLIVSGQV